MSSPRSVRSRASCTLLLAVLLLCLTGCSRPAPAQQQEMVGFRLSSSKPPLAEQDPGTRLDYTLGPDGVFRGTVEIQNLRPATHEYTMVVLVDYAQTAFREDGRAKRRRTFRLGPNETAWIPFEVGPLPAGRHDLSVAALIDLADRDLDIKGRWDTAETGLVGCRAVVAVPGSRSFPAPLKAMPRPPGPSDEPSATERPVVNATPASAQVETTLSAGAGELRQLFLHLGNPSQETRGYAMVPMLDGEQLTDPAGKPIVVFAESGPGASACYEIVFKAPLETGTHELVVLGSVNPYSTLRDDSFAESLMEKSLRVALTVR